MDVAPHAGPGVVILDDDIDPGLHTSDGCVNTGCARSLLIVGLFTVISTVLLFGIVAL